MKVRVIKMAKKMENVIVNGKSLTIKEKAIYDKVASIGQVVANDLLTPDTTIQSVRATLARLEKTHNLLKGSKVIKNDKAIMQYKVSE